MSLTIATMLIGPLAGWAASTLRHQGTARDELGRATATGILNTYYLRDVASARTATTGVNSCLAGTQGILQLPQSGGSGITVVYAVGTTNPAPLWRLECGSAGLLDRTTVLDRVDTGADAPSASVDGREATLTLTPMKADAAASPIVLTAVRRAGTVDGTGGTGFTGSNSPDAVVQVSPTQGYRDTLFTLDAGASSDPDGDALVGFTWTLPAGAQPEGPTDGPVVRIRFDVNAGSDPIAGLAITDATGASAATSVTVHIFNRNPNVGGTTCTPANAESTSFTLTVDATDPDGDPIEVLWSYSDELIGAGTSINWTPPSGLVGSHRVSVLVTDGSIAEPGQASGSVVCNIGPPVVGVGGIGISPSAVVVRQGEPAVINAARPGAPLQVTFTALDPIDSGSAVSFELYRRGESSPIETVADISWTYSFAVDQAGEYEVVRVDTPATGVPIRSQPVPFRVNAAPTAEISIFAEAGEVPARIVHFESVSDDDRAVQSRVWDFGDGTQLTDPGPTPSHVYESPGDYVARLTVIDDDGATTTDTVTVTIPEAAP